MREVACDSLRVLYLIRYIKPTHIYNEDVKDEAFQLRDWTPPEEYVSFYHSKSKLIRDKINDVKKAMPSNFEAKKTSGYIHLNATKASEEINVVKNIIEFKERGYPHYGMFYLSNYDVDVIEAKTILIHYSELYMNCNYMLEKN